MFNFPFSGRMRRLLYHSYAQKGEDMLIDGLLMEKTINRFYVDIGAFDPEKFSNTKYFYDAGWRGINVEPNTVFYDKFIDARPRDINLNYGCGLKEERMLLKIFGNDYATFSDEQEGIFNKHGHQRTAWKEVPIYPLSKILDDNLPKGQKIDFLTIDTDGMDLQVLQSNNWEKYKPTIVMYESMNLGNKPFNLECGPFLEKQGYKLVADTVLNKIYMLI